MYSEPDMGESESAGRVRQDFWALFPCYFLANFRGNLFFMPVFVCYCDDDINLCAIGYVFPIPGPSSMR